MSLVLDPLGRVFWQFDGNNWTPEQLMNVISKAARFAQVDLPTNRVTNPNGLY